MGKTKIEWATDVWNPITGCDPISPGCAHCWAERFAERFRGVPGHPFEHGFDLQLRPERLDEPLRWRKPRRIFVCSMADLFHENVPDEYIDEVWARMALAPQHTFQVLTKRPERMRDYVNEQWHRTSSIYNRGWMLRDQGDLGAMLRWLRSGHLEPLPNVWIGTSVENQRVAHDRVTALLQTPATVRWISAEPLLGPLVAHCKDCHGTGIRGKDDGDGWVVGTPCLDCIGTGWTGLNLTGIDWLVVGGESGPGARPMHPDWVRDLRDAAKAAGVAFLFKQWGEYIHSVGEESPAWNREPDLFVSDTGHVGTSEQALEQGWSSQGMWRVGKRAAGRQLDGRIWDEYPR
jgi:protein gp37